MSGSKMNINISGGNVNVGNLNQGDNAQLSSTQTISIDQVEQFEKELQQTAANENINAGQIAELEAQVQTLIAEQQKPDFIEKAKALYEKYNWAAVPLKNLFGALIL